MGISRNIGRSIGNAIASPLSGSAAVSYLGIAQDMSSNSNDGTLNNFDLDTAWVAGPNSDNPDAISADGVNQNVTMGQPAALKLTAAVSVAIWFKLDSAASDRGALIGYHDSTTRGYAIWLLGGNIRHVLGEVGAGYFLNLQYAAPVDAGWHHYALTFDGDDGKAYLDAVEKDTHSLTATLDYSEINDLKLFSEDADDFYVSGDASGARIYSDALTANEVSFLHDSGTGTDPGAANLVGYWPGTPA